MSKESKFKFNHNLTDIYSSCSITMKEVLAFSNKIKSIIKDGTERSIATEIIENAIKNNRVALRIAVLFTVSFLEKNLLKYVTPEDSFNFNELSPDICDYNHKNDSYLECCGVTLKEMEHYIGNIVSFIREESSLNYSAPYSKIVEYVENACLENNKALRLTSMITTDTLFRQESHVRLLDKYGLTLYDYYYLL